MRGNSIFAFLWLFFLLRMYPLIISFKTINKLKLFFECGFPRPQDVEHLCLRFCNYLTYFIISIAVLENVPPDAGFQKRATFSTLNVDLAGTGILSQLPLKLHSR
jgi:hypothetical protein